MGFRPWVFLAIAFALLITAWSTLIVVALRISPERVSIVQPVP